MALCHAIGNNFIFFLSKNFLITKQKNSCNTPKKVLTEAYPTTISPASSFKIFGLLTCFFLGSYVGFAIDHTPRLALMLTSLIVQNISVVFASGCLLALFWLEPRNQEITYPFWPFQSFITPFFFFGSIQTFNFFSFLINLVLIFQKNF